MHTILFYLLHRFLVNCAIGQLFHENALDNLLVQHVNFNTRHRVNNNPSRLDLIFTNEEEMIENISSKAPIGLSDHVRISFELVL